MSSNKIIKLVSAALMAAIVCVVTMTLAFPTPIGGYIHPGDGFVILSGVILGPFYGGLAAGIGSMLADLLLGYSSYAGATLIIKGLAAIAAALLFRALHRNNNHKIIPILLSGFVAGCIVSSGYFLYEGSLLGLGYGSALANVPFNLLQNAFGIVISIVLFPLLYKVPQIRSIIQSK